MKQRIRIGLLVNSNISAEGLLAYRQLTKSLNALEHRAFLLSFQLPEHQNDREGEESTGEYKAALKFTAEAKKLKLQAIVFSNFRLAALLISAKTLMKGKLKLIYIQNRQADNLKSDRLNIFRVNQLDAWISPLQATANEIRGLTQIPQDRIHINTIPMRLTKAKGALAIRDRFRKDQKLTDDKLVLGIELHQEQSPPREIHTLLRCLAQSELLRKRIFLVAAYRSCKPHAPVDPENFLSNSLKEIGMQQSFVQIDSSVRQDDFLSILDIALLISDNEPFEAVAFQALARGIHCLGSSTLVTSEMLGNGRYGWLYNRGSEDSMFETIGYLLHHIDQGNEPLEKPMRIKRPEFAKSIAEIIRQAIKA